MSCDITEHCGGFLWYILATTHVRARARVLLYWRAWWQTSRSFSFEPLGGEHSPRHEAVIINTHNNSNSISSSITRCGWVRVGGLLGGNYLLLSSIPPPMLSHLSSTRRRRRWSFHEKGNNSSSSGGGGKGGGSFIRSVEQARCLLLRKSVLADQCSQTRRPPISVPRELSCCSLSPLFVFAASAGGRWWPRAWARLFELD